MKADYHFAFFDEGSKREIRRAILKGIAIPGYQVPFASREMPIARGWGTGGLQLTLSLVGREDLLKVIDQGSDESVNAVNIKKLISMTTGIETTDKTGEATLIQSRHRIPEQRLTDNQILVLQVPIPEPLRFVEASERKTKKCHGEKEYSGAYLQLFEEIIRHGKMATGSDHPVEVENRYVMAPSPIPKFDNPKMNQSAALILLGAGREKKIYAVPPYSKVESLGFEDYPFEKEDVKGRVCRICGSEAVFMDELEEGGKTVFQCNDSSFCLSVMNRKEKVHG